MWIYASTPALVGTTLATLFLLLWMATGQNPYKVVKQAAQYVLAEPRALFAVAAAYSMIALNLLELRLEQRLAPQVTWDFTPVVARFGTPLIHALQRLEWPPLTHLLTWVYVVLFTMLMLGALLVYAYNRDFAALRHHVIAYWANYLIALPFYLWVPVKEAWAGEAGVRFLIPQVFPAFEAVMRPHSGLDNCVPSLHTSLALTYALVAWRSGYRRLGAILGVGAGLVMLSTLYLGVHWVFDMLAGVLLAFVASGYLLPSPAAVPGRGRIQTDP